MSLLPRRLWPLPRSLHVVILSFAVTGVTGLSALLTAKWLGAGPRGVLILAQTITSMAALILALGLVQSTRILLADVDRGLTLTAYARSTRWLLAFDAVVTVVVGVPLFMWLARVRDPIAIAAFVVTGVALFRSQLNREALHGIGRHRTAVIGDLIAGLVPFVLIGACHYVAPSRLTIASAMIFLALGPVSGQIMQEVVLRGLRGSEPPSHHTRAEQWDLLRTIVKFSVPGLVAALGYLVAGRIDRLILGAFSSTATVGVYGTAATLSDLAWTLPVSLSAVIVRSVAQTKSLAGHRMWWGRIMAASALLCGVMYVVSLWLLPALGKDFSSGVPILAVLLIGSLAMASQQVDLAFCNGMGDLKASARSALWGIAVGIPAYLILTPLFGVMGTAMGNNLTFITMAVKARLILNQRIRQEVTA